MPSSLLFSCLVFLLFFIIATSDINKDKHKQECADDLLGLATCLPYVSDQTGAKNPPIDCCTGLKEVLHRSPQCLCLLVKDRNDPSLGLKINASIALGLPSHCHESANALDYPALLHLPLNSPEAKVFEDFASNGPNHSAIGKNTTATPVETTADGKSDGGKRRKAQTIEMVFVGVVLLVHNLLHI